MDAEETECHDMGTPFGPSPTGTAAGSDPAAVKHHSHVVGPFGRDHLRWHHCSTQVEPWGKYRHGQGELPRPGSLPLTLAL